MSAFETYSKRKKKKQSSATDVFQYEDLPLQFRNQIIHIWDDAIGPDKGGGISSHYHNGTNNEAWEFIHSTISRELGVFTLGDGRGSPHRQCQSFIRDAESDHVLDIIELSFRVIDTSIRRMHPYTRESHGIEIDSDEAIEELNQRFKEHNIGYQFLNGEIVRVDSEFIHDQVIKPALSLLRSEDFSGAEEEFRKAHEHYRHRRYKEALVEALKSFESTLKTVCDKNQWTYPKNVTSKALVEIVFNNNLLPSELHAHFTAVRATLESGIPTVRNSKSGHGQGAKPIPVPDYIVSYGLHLTAAGIVFLVEAMTANTKMSAHGVAFERKSSVTSASL